MFRNTKSSSIISRLRRITATLCVIYAQAALCEQINLVSNIERVTLFQGSADVTRHAKFNLPSGKHEAIFSGIPNIVNSDSLRISGNGIGDAAILGVELKTRNLATQFSKEAEDIKQKIEALELAIAEVTANIERINSQRAQVNNVQLDRTLPADVKEVVRPRTPQEMQGVLSFITEATQKLDAQLKQLNEKNIQLNKELSIAKLDEAKYNPSNSTETIVEVGITSDKPIQGDLYLTYQISGAGWNPSYNLNIKEGSKENEFKLDLYGMVTQRTGENWENVNLILSTARPQVGLNRPIPLPKFLDIYQPMPRAQSYDGAILSKKSRALGAAEGISDLSQESSDSFAASQSAALEEKVAQISDAGVLTYTISNTSTVKSDGSTQKMKLATILLNGTLKNISVPASSLNVFREATLVNNGTAPLLRGAINIFSSGEFVGRQYLDYTPPGKEVKMPVGLSDQISINRKQTKHFEDDSGVVRSFRRIVSAYEIEVENLTHQTQEIIILESTPLSKNEKIKVIINKVEPASLEIKDQNRIHKTEGVLEWQIKLDPNSKKALSYEVTTEFESDLSVSGLEAL